MHIWQSYFFVWQLYHRLHRRDCSSFCNLAIVYCLAWRCLGCCLTIQKTTLFPWTGPRFSLNFDYIFISICAMALILSPARDIFHQRNIFFTDFVHREIYFVLPRKMGQNESFSNFNLQILSSNFNLRACFVKLFNFKLSKTCWKSPKLNKRILAHFEKMSLARWFSAFFEKKVFCLVKWAKTNAFFDTQDEG